MTYSTRADTELVYGSENVQKWADINNLQDRDEITDRVAWAIEQAYDDINARLKNCKYTVPFASPYDPIVVDLSARQVGIVLYDSRMLVDSPEFDALQFHRKTVEEMFVKIHGGQLSLITYTPTAVNFPQAISSED